MGQAADKVSQLELLGSPVGEVGQFNESGLHPQGVAVLVRPYEPDVGQQVIALPDSVRSSLQLLEQRAVVVEVGPEAWRDEGQPRAQPGDHVMIAKYAGVGAVGPKDGKQYRIVNSRDIYCTIEVMEEAGNG